MSPNIPLIDFTPAFSESLEDRKQLAEAVYSAAHNAGFMYIKNIGLSSSTIEKAFALHAAFFALPESEKEKVYYRNPADQHGYSAVGAQTLQAGTKPDVKASFISRNIREKAKDPTLWPSPEFRDGFLEFFNEMHAATANVLDIFGLALGLPEEHFRKMHTGVGQSMRFLHYPPVEKDEEDLIGAGAHTDFGSLTFLLQDSVGGLEIQTLKDEWIAAPPIPGTFVVNTGDLMNRWTNEVFRSTPHRVLANRSKQSRQSIAFFSNPDPDVLIETIPSCITPENPAKYTPITAQEHISARVKATMHMDKVGKKV